MFEEEQPKKQIADLDSDPKDILSSGTVLEGGDRVEFLNRILGTKE